jgi:tetratricopeptide (TPR) repeat protein
MVLEAMGFEVEAAHHEVAPGQHEIDFKYAEAVACADNVATFRFVVKKVAQDYGLHATFMPKPIFGVNGSGMHTHQSLLDGKGQERLLRPDAAAPALEGGHELHRRHPRPRRAFVAVTNPLVNSYKRLVPGLRGADQRRLVGEEPLAAGPGTGQARHVHPLRGAGARPGVQPLPGARRDARRRPRRHRAQARPGEPVNKNIFTMSEREKRRLKISQLPANLSEALDNLERDPVVKEALGDHIFDNYLRAKRQEWAEYISQVHPWELVSDANGSKLSSVPRTQLSPLVFFAAALALSACRSSVSDELSERVSERSALSRAGPGAPEAFSLLGEPLYAPELPEEVRGERERELAAARARLAAAPGDPEALIWVGRRLGYLGRYREAVAAFSEGVAGFPDDARFLRHRGHRFLTLRRLELAEADLARAGDLVRGRPDEIEPDGQPNDRGIPTSTLQANVWYHLGLARYLQGDFEGALASYRECLAVSTNPDMRVATSHWLYTTLRRLGPPGEESAEAAEVLAPIHAGLDIIENRAYHRLLLMYRGEVSPEELLAEAGGDSGSLDFVTIAYGVAAWHLYNGREDQARKLFDRIFEGGQWAAFGYLAAEAEVARPRAYPFRKRTSTPTISYTGIALLSAVVRVAPAIFAVSATRAS